MPSPYHRCTVTAPSLSHRCTAPSLHQVSPYHRCTITALSLQGLCFSAVNGIAVPPSLRHDCTITAPSLHHFLMRLIVYRHDTITAPSLPPPPDPAVGPAILILAVIHRRSLHHHRTITAPSPRHHRTITAPSLHHHCTITAPSPRHRCRRCASSSTCCVPSVSGSFSIPLS